jgi:serine/threonine-protein kinase
MLTGERLFARSDAVATLAAVLDGEIPRPSTRNVDVPARLEELAMRALERDQATRWATAGDMLAALNKFLYSLDETPGPREVAALVARYCPPETRRLPTHLEAIAHEARDDASGPVGEPKAGPSTAVIPREGAAAAAGKRPQRHQTFATHVELRDMLGGASDASAAVATGPTTKVTDRANATHDAATPARPVSKRPRRPTTERPASVEPDDRPAREHAAWADDDPDRPIPRPPRPPLQPDRPPSRAALVLVGLGGLALAGAVVYMVFDRKDEVLHMGDKDARVADAPPPIVDAGAVADGPEAHGVDAATTAPADAGVAHPARDAAIAVVVTRDAAVHADAESLSLRDAGTAIATGSATLKLGASPWAKIFIDGKQQRGQTPATLEVPAGHHDVRLVFDAESPPLEKTYSIDIKVGETQSYQAEFTP